MQWLSHLQYSYVNQGVQAVLASYTYIDMLWADIGRAASTRRERVQSECRRATRRTRCLHVLTIYVHNQFITEHYLRTHSSQDIR